MSNHNSTKYKFNIDKTRKLTDFKGEKITYVNSPKKSIKDKISLLAKPNGSADEIITKVDYKLLKEISKELEQ